MSPAIDGYDEDYALVANPVLPCRCTKFFFYPGQSSPPCGPTDYGRCTTGEEFDHYGSVDALTGLRSRKWLDHMMQRQFMRSTTCGEPLSLLMIDIDHFKDFNDQHGYAYGDRVLYAIAQTLSNHLRPIDIIARYGGDEFIILLPNITINAAREVANRLHREVMKAVPLMPIGRASPIPPCPSVWRRSTWGRRRRRS